MEAALEEDFYQIYDQRLLFRKTLASIYSKIKPHIAQNPFIVNVGCGKCNEGTVLNEFFRGCSMLGIDNNSLEIDYAKAQNPYSNYRFQVADAKYLPKIIDEKADILLFRHPNFSNNDDDVYKQALKVLKPNGLVLATNAINLEHEQIESKFNKLGLEIILSKVNPHATLISQRGPFTIYFSDGYLLAATKPEKKGWLW